ncbi:MAG: aldehyde dehydrogenase family protein, partial [Pseudolysinimonas sp.]
MAQRSNQVASRGALWPLSPDGHPVASRIAPNVELTGQFGGAWPVDDPATGQVVGWCEPTSLDELDTVVDAALNAFPAWAALAPSGRSAAMVAGAELVEEHLGELAACLVKEVGKTGHES